MIEAFDIGGDDDGRRWIVALEAAGRWTCTPGWQAGIHDKLTAGVWGQSGNILVAEISEQQAFKLVNRQPGLGRVCAITEGTAPGGAAQLTTAAGLLDDRGATWTTLNPVLVAEAVETAGLVVSHQV
jgi:hypothetical protein